MKKKHTLSMPGTRTLAMLLLLTIFPIACGYRFDTENTLPGGVNTLFIQLVENRTGETGLDVFFTNQLVDKFQRNSAVRITEKTDDVATLTGVIRNLRIRTVTRSGPVTAQERRVFITADLFLNHPDGHILQSATGLTGSETYIVASEKTTTEYYRTAAEKKLLEKLAEEGFRRLGMVFDLN